jgi:hypothetical protein
MTDEQQPQEQQQPKVRVKALQAHTAFGESYAIGDTYEVNADLVDSLRIQGKAVPDDPADHAQRQARGELVMTMNPPGTPDVGQS